MKTNIKYLNETKRKIKRKKEEKIKFLIIHHTAWKNSVNIWRWKWKQVSFHYLINKEWVVYFLVWEEYIAFHTWKSNKGPHETTRWGWNLNPISIWIELENLWNWIDEYPEKQIEALKVLSKDIIKRNKIKIENVLWHKEITNRKIDPSANFFEWDMDWFRNYLKWNKKNDSNESFDRYKIFEDFSKNWEIKKLVEIWLYRFIKLIKSKKLKKR